MTAEIPPGVPVDDPEDGDDEGWTEWLAKVMG